MMRAWQAMLVGGVVLAGAIGVPASPGTDDPADILDIREVPIDGLLRVTRLDGKIFYTSRDRRWVIVGEVIDMWTGLNEPEMTTYDQMSWRRAGASPEQVGLEEWSTNQVEAVLFMQAGCEDCLDLMARARARKRSIAPAPVGDPFALNGWQGIWCQQGVTEEHLAKWLRSPESFQRTCDERRAGRATAFAEIFRLDGQGPSLIDRQGRIYRGKEQIEQWLSES